MFHSEREEVYGGRGQTKWEQIIHAVGVVKIQVEVRLNKIGVVKLK